MFALFCADYQQFILEKWKIPVVDDAGQQRQIARVLDVMRSPLMWVEEFPMGGGADLSWLGALPDTVRIRAEHYRKVLAGEFNESVKGVLSTQTPTSVPAVERFLKVESVKMLFVDKLAPIQAPEPTAEGKGESLAGAEETILRSSMAKTKDALAEELNNRADELLSEKFIALVPEESPMLQTTLQANLVKAGLLQGAGCAYYDVKNALLAKRTPGQNVYHTEPECNEDDLGRFINTCNELLNTRKAFPVWISCQSLSGRTIAVDRKSQVAMLL
jgi:hypothetical protein